MLHHGQQLGYLNSNLFRWDGTFKTNVRFIYFRKAHKYYLQEHMDKFVMKLSDENARMNIYS